MGIAPVGLGLRSNPGRDTAISAARIINGYVENVGEEGKLTVPIVASDSFEERDTLTSGGACAGMLALDATALYIVSGNNLYKNTAANVTSTIGTVTNSGWVQMGRNRKSTPQIGILTDAGVFQVCESDSLSTVSEAFLTGLVGFVAFEGYGVLIKSNGEFYISTLDDYTAYDELDFETATASPHGLLGGASRGGELVLFGPRATLFYDNTGATDFPLERTQVIDIGCYAPRAVQEIVIPGDGGTVDSIIWPATDAKGAYIGVVALSGYSGNKISNHAVDRAIRSEDTINNIRALTWAEGGHTFYGLHTSTETWVHDVTTGLWHERTSSGEDRWRINAAAAFDGVTVLGDYSSAKIYDAGPDVSNGLTCNAALRYSKDNADNWITATTKAIGGSSARGNRFKWTRFGQSREDGVILEIKITNAVSEDGTGNDLTIIPPHLHAWPNPIEINALYVDVVPGSSGTSVVKSISGLSADVEAVPFT